MAQSGGGGGGGQIAAKRGKLSSSDADAGADGEDRLSALPDEVLVLILLRLRTTTEAARTSVLARRWRRVWLLLPELRFHLAPDGHRIRKVLLAPNAPPPLHRISVVTEDSAPDSLGAWLPDAARRLSGALVYHRIVPGVEDLASPMPDEAGEGGAIQLPCFEKATRIEINLGLLGLDLPLAGTFAQLTELSLYRVHLRGPIELGDFVSSPRSPRLQKLRIRDARGVDKLTIHSESLLEVDLRRLKGFQRLSISASALNELNLLKCFGKNQPVAFICAPQLESLAWTDSYDPSSVDLGNLGQLQVLRTNGFFVFSKPDCRYNRDFLRLLQQFRFIRSLGILVFYQRDIGNFPYLMEDITMLPLTEFLTVEVVNNGHNFGPSSFHILRLCTGIRRLSMKLHIIRGLKSACHPGCICDQPANWKAQELSLNRLRKVELAGLEGTEHEVVFLEQLFSWATVLKKMEITFDYSVSKSKARELLRTLASFSRPETLVEFYMYHDAGKKSVFLLAPEDQEDTQ
ncbi:unnamed protein product [Urochloa decumbens]|uniref:F-box domain-containing protein n=1 Tax=Urochloa decumbens TaxID=240449 RepID=A0ABC9FM83_9POAL